MKDPFSKFVEEDRNTKKTYERERAKPQTQGLSLSAYLS